MPVTASTITLLVAGAALVSATGRIAGDPRPLTAGYDTPAACLAANRPVLRLSIAVTLTPVWMATEDAGCRLSHLSISRYIGMPDGAVLLDSANQAAYARFVLARVDESTEITLRTPSGVVTAVISSDSVEFDYPLGLRIKGTGPQIVASGIVRDAAFLQALLDATSMTARTRNPQASRDYNRLLWLQDANRWMQRVQAMHRSLSAPDSFALPRR